MPGRAIWGGVVEVFEDRFANIEGLGATGALGKFFEAFLDRLWKANRQHRNLAIQV